ncbi:hypothetical protein DXD59_03030 [Olsenella sp. TM06-36]|jgi:uncharacterized membrane protein YidH (DUF202 family)|uniref:DUF308 domain-containing protein n=1 Tax=Tractidigestivibacter montrealensis TaxID=2972466 RepID=A0ABT1Z6Y4_9ACTN|nr:MULTISPECIES: DUF308 domain-containing protein [Atopobiaceae]MCR9035969.1 DUF308 domain-containing protein [Tractidigestivibacter montrealensis]RGJ47868.1 hypothetical protein DXD59_03030 [Olsenella sp. TM06-36]
MDQKFASTKLGTIVSGVALAAMGIILFTNPQSAMLTITVMLGWVLVVMGIVSLASALTRWSVILSTADLYAGIVELLFGILLVNIPGFFVTWIFILLGIFILVSGLNSLYGANALQALGLPRAGTAKVGAILAIVLGVLVLFSPGLFADTTMVICGIALVYCGIVRIVDGVRMPSEHRA